MSHVLEEEYHAVTDSLEDMRCIPETIFCELYVVKGREGIKNKTLAPTVDPSGLQG